MMMRNIDDDEVKKKGEEKREEYTMKEEEEFNDNNTSLLHKQHQMGSGRHASVHDHMKLLRHTSQTIKFESSSSLSGGGEVDIGGNSTVTYATESQCILCLAKVVGVYAASIPSTEGHIYFITKIAAPAFGVTADAAQQYIETRKPVVTVVLDVVEIGRARMCLASSYPTRNNNQAGQNNQFAET
eukprot:3416556-Ditylum_brightwellii.AAC.1